MSTRNLEPGEQIIDVMQRTCPMTFTMIARLTGEVSEAKLERALRMLETRHPLLRTRIVRTNGPLRLEFGTAEPIPLHCERAAPDAWLARTEDSLTKRWAGNGPRAELVCLQHDAGRSTLLFTGDHLVADGLSAMMAVRDLLRFTQATDEHVAEQSSPPQSVLLPPDIGSLRNRVRGLRYLLSGAMAGKSDRPRVPGPFPIEGRKARVQVISLDRSASQELATRARQEGATVHGVLGAAFAVAISQTCGRDMHQRIFHPIDLRHYGKQNNANAVSIDDAYGYFVSVAETAHDVPRNASVAELARGVTQAVRDKKASGEPLVSGPVAGGILTKAAALMSAQRFCNFAENSLFRAAFTMSHGGRLEDLGIAREYGSIRIDDLFGTTLSSVATPFCVGSAMWDGRINVTVSSVEPLVPFELAQGIVQRARQHAETYARTRSTQSATQALEL